MGQYDPPFSFDLFVDELVRHRDYVKGLEQRLKRTERERDMYRDQCDPDWRKREIEAALDGEIRIMHQ